MTFNTGKRGRGPIVAVTGHRDLLLQDLPLLEQAVDRVLGQIQASAVEGTATLLSGLAEGADRLVAERALALGWQIVAVLALPADEFEEDFASEASRAEFRELLSKCAKVVEASVSGTPRPSCYANVAERIVATSDWLIALWDGSPAAGSGGTAEVVARFLMHSLEVCPKERARVAHLFVRRSSEAEANLGAVPGDGCWICLDAGGRSVRRSM